MARLRFYGGVGVIGSTKIVVEQDGWRVVLDVGDDIPGREGIVRGPLRLPAGSELRTRLRVGEAPPIEHFFRPEAVAGTGLAGGGDGRTVLCLSHCHIDHVGLLDWVDPGVPVHAAPETVRMLGALGGGAGAVQPLAEGESLAVGPLVVERYAVDHDIPGASGFLVRTEDGVVAYTGDFRLHGRHPELTERFAERARGAAVLVTEGTTLSADPRVTVRFEREVDAAFDDALAQTPGLVLMSVYPRDIERIVSFQTIAGRHGRVVLWPAAVARFLRAWGLDDIRELDEEALAAARAEPSRFVVQVDVERLDILLDLPVGPGAVFLHANGEPLGPFQAGWELLQQWLAFLRVPFTVIGSSGHATPHDLHRVAELVAPKVLYPVHTIEPWRFAPPPGTLRVLAEYGRWYDVARGPAAAPRKRGTVCVDLDSTLCDTSHRHHLVAEVPEETDWVAYSLACADDAPIDGVCRLVQLLAQDYRIVVVSSRDRSARELTEAWLEAHEVPYDELILGGGDDAPAALEDFKVHHVGEIVRRDGEVALMIDDLPGVRDAMRGLGVPVVTVRPPYS